MLLGKIFVFAVFAAMKMWFAAAKYRNFFPPSPFELSIFFIVEICTQNCSQNCDRLQDDNENKR